MNPAVNYNHVETVTPANAEAQQKFHDDDGDDDDDDDDDDSSNDRDNVFRSTALTMRST